MNVKPKFFYPGYETPIIDSVSPPKVPSGRIVDIVLELSWDKHSGDYPEYQVSGVVTEFLNPNCNDPFPKRQSERTVIRTLDMQQRKLVLIARHEFDEPGQYYLRVTFGQHHDIGPSVWSDESGAPLELTVT